MTARGEAIRFLVDHLDDETDECVIWPYRKRSGYGYVGSRRDTVGVHVVACIVEHGPRPPDKREVGHRCGRRDCFNRRHVRWVTKAENEADAVHHGTHTRGARNGKARLTVDQVRLILTDRRNGVELAELLGVSKACISRVRTGRTYREVSSEMGMQPWAT